jgi:hypothetical protein
MGQFESKFPQYCPIIIDIDIQISSTSTSVFDDIITYNPEAGTLTIEAMDQNVDDLDKTEYVVSFSATMTRNSNTYTDSFTLIVEPDCEIIETVFYNAAKIVNAFDI